MINLNEYQSIFDQSKIWQKGTQDVEVEIWDQVQKQFFKTNILITFTEDYSIFYQQDGVILRSFQRDSFKINPQNPLKFSKDYGFWNGEAQIEVGGYFEDGVKIGLWSEIAQNYWCKSQVQKKGVYINNHQRGYWKYSCNNNMIGGGQCNEQGIKVGKWVELSENFKEDSQVVYKGEYKNGKKLGIWETFQKCKQIGGFYCESNGVSMKTGKWCELIDGFSDNSKVTYIGVYKNGMKIGKWDIWWIEDKKYQIIGGGSYDEISSIKNGKWIELNERFKKDSQVKYIGVYQNNKKIGNWNIFWENQLIGGGLYNEEGSFKIGKWIELSDRFQRNSQVTYSGHYKKGQKVGKWNIFFRENDEFYQIGGGKYDDECSIKSGKWIEPKESFNLYSQVTFNGQYKNGKKVGKWTIWNRDFRNGENQQIGGGLYDESNSMKIGKWTELNDGFHFISQVTQVGEYKMDKKSENGILCIRRMRLQAFNQCGLYDEQGSIKRGRWIELSDGFYRWSQVTYLGEYNEWRKVGVWNIEYDGKKIGGGQYDEQFSMKFGSWIELSDDFYVDSQVIHKGDYKNGKKFGRWDILFRFSVNNSFKQIAGGSYDEGNKI
ncbi:unnamed protein product [Paramecium sonneborni]|uniref:Uncharacterized protein n=1 Tax=Paramecium sonneborni TaxID=65129 RepID=A0A8S1RPI2_9CILI|nr:unnamed protein product [Paramecium sonneborni]